MRVTCKSILMLGLVLTLAGSGLSRNTVFETTSPYHHIRVADYGRMRILHFDNSTQSQISLDDPLQGHFEYTEYFHMPWLWNDQIKTVLMIGLGGSSIQRAYQAHWPQVETETVELDPKVVEVARDYFQFQETDKMKAIISDGRMHLRRTPKKYDLIILDAYTANRYGSFIPYTLVTKEFFALTHAHLSDKGVLAYNVIGSAYQRQKNILGSIYRTLKTSFPQVYMFPALGSRNVVVLATKSPEPVTRTQLEQRLAQLVKARPVTFPNFETRLKRFLSGPPASASRSRVLTDDFAPVDGMLRTE
jgi:spermidine synthase